MNGVAYYRLYVGCSVVGVVYSAVDAVSFVRNNPGGSVYRVYFDGTAMVWRL